MKTKASLLSAIFMISGFFFTQIDLAAQEENKKADSTDIADEMAKFVGGNEALYAFLRQNLEYPKEAREKGIKGTVIVEFVVEKTGKISNIRVIQFVSPELDKEAIRVIELMPKWEPAKSSGKPIKTICYLPIRFSFKSTVGKNRSDKKKKL